jgi:pheromone shutdown-related protein TraB
MGEIIIVGTAHISERSIEEVKRAIETKKPDVVAVELCRGRYEALRGETKDISIKEILKGGKIYLFLAQWFLSFIQKRMGSSVGVEPGAEIMAAIEKADETGAEIALVDRDINITLRRFLGGMTFFERIKVLFSLFRVILGKGRGEEIELDRITDEDVVSTLLDELRKFSPTAALTLVDERDAYIASNLLYLAKEKRVVAVVGAGHREGLMKYIENPQLIPPREDLTGVKKSRVRILNEN